MKKMIDLVIRYSLIRSSITPVGYNELTNNESTNQRITNKKLKNILTNLNKAFDHRNRLGIMSILMVNDWVTFNTLKEMLNLADGTLASHIKALESTNYLEVRKEFVDKKPQTSYSATVAGRKAFNEHLDALEALLKNRD